MDALPELYRPAITRAVEFYFGVPAPAPVIAAQIRQESNWNAAAKSRVGASGLMQFMPATAKWAAQAGGFGLAAPLDPDWSIRAGVWYDRHLYDRISGATPCDKWLFTLSAYNGGAGWVYERQTRSSVPLDWITTSVINPGITASNQAENEAYPFRIVYEHQFAFRAWGATVCI